ncbi:outer membrane beta-barrel protein [Neptunomonas antarctica]|uniref:Outer membrane protein beta-barrel domain-containing protein n=1 Tax=Neptunomonas antarctica TaxID=619304 RepID=A0A1N7L0S0_9GAMM|nr:outer membrane beta-barrel protein [Neptunomonas antarctica]SIS67449.1 hypothetical protein SAMN05421760_103130 [Neptunomonas antarctica]
MNQKLTLASAIAKTIFLTVPVTTVFLSTAVYAAEQINQLTPDETPAMASEEPQDDDAALQEHRIGSFVAQPQLTLFLGHEDNIFAEHNDEKSDQIHGLAGSFSLDSDWQQHKLNASAGFESGRYNKYDTENYDDYWITTEGRYDINPQTNIFAGLGLSEEHEERGSLDDLFGDAPTTYTSLQAHAGVSHQWDNYSFRLGSTFEKLDFDNVGGSALSNDDRDRDLVGLGGRLSYKVSPRFQPFLQVVIDKRDYDSELDDNGYSRDSDGYRFSLGAEGRLSNTVSGEAHIGYIRQDYDDSRFSNVDELDLGGNLKWQLSPYTQFNAYVKRTLEETTLAGASGNLLTTAGANIKHHISRNGVVTADVTVGSEEYQGTSRDSSIFDAGLSYRHYITNSIYLDTRYRIKGRDSSETRLGDSMGDSANQANIQDYDDYYSNEIFFTLGALLYPVRDSSRPPLSIVTPEFAAVRWSGGYLGAEYGYGAATSEVVGARDQGVDIGEYGDMGSSYDLFFGYGWRYKQWYVGLEGEYGDSGTDINHSKSKDDAQTISVSKDTSYAGAARLGYVLPSGSLMYARLGRVSTEFDTVNKVNNQATGYDDKNRQTGARYGVGVDIPANDHLFVRLDYSVTGYDSYNVDYLDNTGSPTSAVYNNDEALFKVGLGWYFDKQYESAKKVKVDRDGIYAGVQVGHGSLGSATQGIHQDNGVTSSFQGDFAAISDLSLGGFVGYGATHNKWYFAVEAEADSSETDWTHVREPGGRDFSVEKKGSYGVGVRLGYVLDNGSLLYVRGGKVKTKFNTDWNKGSSLDNKVERDDNVWGSRLGVGAEVPVTDHVSMRFDYTHTNYGEYSFVTEHSQPDAMSFKNDETLFRLGVSVTF